MPGFFGAEQGPANFWLKNAPYWTKLRRPAPTFLVVPARRPGGGSRAKAKKLGRAPAHQVFSGGKGAGKLLEKIIRGAPASREPRQLLPLRRACQLLAAKNVSCRASLRRAAPTFLEQPKIWARGANKTRPNGGMANVQEPPRTGRQQFAWRARQIWGGGAVWKERALDKRGRSAYFHISTNFRAC